MSITLAEYSLIRRLRELGLIKVGGTLIEFGEANWYGDVSPSQLLADIDKFAMPDEAAALKRQLEELTAAKPKYMLFDIARIFYKCFLSPSAHTSIDLTGTERALKRNLNEPLTELGQYDMMFDFGTAEHVFDTRQFFANAHNVTRPNGLMIHGLPWMGWIDHGFYNFHPTLYFDLAAANNYTIHTICYAVLDPFEIKSLNTRESFAALAKSGEIAPNAMLFAVLSKPGIEQAFRTPMQGYYTGTLSEDLMQTWRTMR